MAPIPWDRIPSLIVGGVLLAMAAWLLWVGIGDRLQRTFAVVLVLQGLDAVLFPWTFTIYDLASRFTEYLNIALPFVLLWFGILYRQRYWVVPRGGSPNPPMGAWLAVVAAALVCEMLYAYDHGLLVSAQGAGPLFLIGTLTLLEYSVLAWVFARDSMRAERGMARRWLYLISVGFALQPIYMAIFLLVENGTAALIDPGQRTMLRDPFVVITRILLLVLVATIVGLLVGLFRQTMSARTRARRPDAGPVPVLDRGRRGRRVRRRTVMGDNLHPGTRHPRPRPI